MNTRSLLVRLFAAITLAIALTAGQLGAQVTTFNDATNDIAPGIATAGGTLDIVKMEVVDTETDVVFTMTVNGNFTAPNSDWGNFMVGIANGKTPGTIGPSGNGWSRPINLNAGGGNGMTHWIGSWVGSGGGSQLWTYADATTNWSGPDALVGFTTSSAGAQSTITYTVSKASLGVTNGDTIIFDAYSSGGGGGDSAVDALSNPTNSITDWPQPYTSVAPTLTKSYLLANTALNTTQDITFSVDMNAQIAVGTFNPATDFVSVDWGTEFGLFQYLDDPEGDGIYTGTASISAPANTPVAYRFTIEPADPGLPLIPETLARSFLMPEEALVTDTVFFNNIAGYRDVTFTVDMSEQETLGNFDPATQTVEVRGSFNNFAAGDVLSAQGGGLYSGTLTIGGAADQLENYKFYIAGPDSLGYETGDNRTFNLAFNPDGAPTPALVLTTAEFRAAALRPVTFSVDMSFQISEGNFNPSEGVVEVRGSFNDWAGTAMSAGENGVYSVTINVAGAQDATALYKFWATGPTWESTPDRTLVLGAPGVPQTVPTVFFNNDSGQIRDITFSVDMSVQVADGNFDPATGVVQLRGLGGFGDAEAQPLTREGETLIYSGTFAVPGDEGSSFAYKFWATGPAFEVIDPNNLFLNRTTVLGPSGVPEVLPTVFFSNQSTPTPVRDVTFSVDMSVQIALGNFDPATGVVEVRGPFNDYVGTALTPGANDIYSGTVSVAGNVGATMQYKFWATGLDYEAGSDRTFVLGEGDVAQTLPTVYFSNNSGQARDVTFSVDMSVQIALGAFDPATGVVEVRGSFNGFSGGDVLTDQGGGIYGGTFSVEGALGETVQYKFWATGLDYESGDDRTFVLEADGAAQTLPTVYFSNDSGQARDVTFSVDMSVQIALGAFDPAGGVVEVRGSFNGFSGGDVLTDQGGGIYGGTFSVAGEVDDTVAYKFFAANAGTDPAEPGYEAGDDRTLVLGPDGDPQILPTVFFSNDSGQVRDITFAVDMSVQVALGLFNPDETDPAVGGIVQVRGIDGDFGSGPQLTRQGATLVYSGTFAVAGEVGSTFGYKFWSPGINFYNVPGNDGFEQINLSDQFENRTVTLSASGVPMDLGTVFFSNQLFYTVGTAPNPFSTTQGTPSAAQSVTINGQGLTADIVAVAPTGFEVSADGITYGSSADILAASGEVTGSNNLFIRIAASAAAGSPTGDVSLTSTGSQPVSIPVSGTVTASGETFDSWSGGQPLTPALQVQYAIGGASSPTATDGVPSVTTLTPSTLSITAVVRTNDPTLTVSGQTLTNLLVGPWTTNNVTVTVVDPQPVDVPEGCQVQTFSTPRDADTKRFLRLQTTLPAQP